MPGFIKSPKDEAKWSKMKEAVSRSKKKPESEFTDKDWALTNYLWHKNEGNLEKAEEMMKSMLKASTSIPSTSIPNPARVGSTAVKMPKTSKQPDPYGKPSLFFKSESNEFEGLKHPTLCKLRDFLQKKHR